MARYAPQHRAGISCGFLCVVSFFICGCSKPTEVNQHDSAAPVNQGRVVVHFRFSDSRQVTRLVEEVPTGSTVLSVMERIEEPEIKISGSGTMSMVTQIGEAENGGERGWTFSVNDKWAERGIGDTTVSDGDEISWRYATWDELQADRTDSQPADADSVPQ